MSEQTDLQPDLRTDAQRFEDAMRTILTAPPQKVAEVIAADRETRKRKDKAKVPAK